MKNELEITVNYIYLLQEREFYKNNENIYKIGKTKQLNFKRFNNYPNGSILLFQMICDNCDIMETELIKLFDIKFKRCKNIGNEYFQGNSNEMIEYIYSLLKTNKLINNQENIKCKYCMNVFYCNNYKDQHETICKMQDDPIRKIEIENNIHPVLPDSKTCCRYCNKNLSSVSRLNKHYLICKKRIEYYELLKKQTNNNILLINNENDKYHYKIDIFDKNILNWGNENVDILLSFIVKFIKLIHKSVSGDYYSLAANLITIYDKEIHSIRINQNIIILDSLVKVKNSYGHYEFPIDIFLNKQFQNIAINLVSRKDEINECDETIFKKTKNKSIFNEIELFSKEGFNYIKTNDKINNIKNGFKNNYIPIPDMDSDW